MDNRNFDSPSGLVSVMDACFKIHDMLKELCMNPFYYAVNFLSIRCSFFFFAKHNKSTGKKILCKRGGKRHLRLIVWVGNEL